MTSREPAPDPTPLCPWHNTRSCVEPADPHEHDRTGCAWRCSDGAGGLFEGTATEFQRIRTRVLLAEAERMASNPKKEK